MKYVSKVLSFIYINRRPIGLLVGSILTILGYTEQGEYLQKVGEV